MERQKDSYTNISLQNWLYLYFIDFSTADLVTISYNKFDIDIKSFFPIYFLVSFNKLNSNFVCSRYVWTLNVWKETQKDLYKDY